jgi:hypothetical protein
MYHSPLISATLTKISTLAVNAKQAFTAGESFVTGRSISQGKEPPDAYLFDGASRTRFYHL